MKGTQLRIFVLLVSSGICWSQSITNPPLDTTVKVGTDTVTLTCGAQPGAMAVFWSRSVHNDVPSDDVYMFFQESATITNTDKFEIVGEHDLVIKNVQFTDAGRYTCKLLANGPSHTASLVVTEAPVILSSEEVIANDVPQQLSCMVSLQGPRLDQMSDKHIPTLVGFLGGVFIENANITISEGIPGVQQWGIELRSSHILTKEMDGHTFSCEIRTNTPQFALKTTSTLDVKFAVENIVFHPNKAEYRVGDVIDCKAEGNPTPSYKWASELPGPRPVSTSYLNITEVMMGENRWTCTAENKVVDLPDFVDKEIAFYVASGPTDEPNISPKQAGGNIGLIVGVVVAVIVIIAIVVVGFIVMKKRKAGSMKPDKPKKPQQDDEEAEYESDDELPTKQPNVNSPPIGHEEKTGPPAPPTSAPPPNGPPAHFGRQVLPTGNSGKPLPQARQASSKPRSDKPQPQPRSDKEVTFQNENERVNIGSDTTV